MAPIKSTLAVKSKKITDFFSVALIKSKNSSAGINTRDINNNDENSPVSTVLLKCRSNEINISNGSSSQSGSANKSGVLDIEPPKKKVCIDENLKSNLTGQIDQVLFSEDASDASASSSDWLNSTAKDNSEIELMSHSQESAELSAIFHVPEFNSSSDRVKFLDLVNMSSPQRDSQGSINFLDNSSFSLGTTGDASDDKDSAKVEMQQPKPRRRLLKYESDDD